MGKVLSGTVRALEAIDLQWLIPFVKLLRWEDPEEQFRRIMRLVVAPMVAFAIFLMLWSGAARMIVTKYGTLPTPSQVWEQAGVLVREHQATKAKAETFYANAANQALKFEAAAALLTSQAATASGARADRLRGDAVIMQQRAQDAKSRKFSSNPTYIDQILTSLKTVFTGFLVASLIAIPLGVLCGMSKTFAAAVNPMIQIFKPVSPLAWLPIVMICVGALYTTDPSDAWFDKSFISSALTVALCSLWPTLMNTALGVMAVEKDHLAVAQVLGLPWWVRVRKIVIPSALPLIFAGLRISLSVGWMVLIAAEMLAQNPGLGKFVWDMFQNGSTQTLAQIMVAVFTIGLIGFFLDRIMVVLQRSVDFST